jgi:thiamine transport system substrate-binding protein
VEYVGILASSDRADDARRLVDFMLSPTIQEDVPLTMFVFPVRSDVTLPDVFTEHAVLPQRPITMAPERIDAGREAWIARFATTVLR